MRLEMQMNRNINIYSYYLFLWNIMFFYKKNLWEIHTEIFTIEMLQYLGTSLKSFVKGDEMGKNGHQLMVAGPGCVPGGSLHHPVIFCVFKLFVTKSWGVSAGYKLLQAATLQPLIYEQF